MIPAMIRLHVPVPVISMNRLGSRWERARAAKLRRQMTHELARQQLMGLLHGVAVDPEAPKRISFVAYGPRLRDGDNLIVKPYIDGLKPLLIHDDSPHSGHLFVLPPEQIVSQRWRGLVITIEPQ